MVHVFSSAEEALAETLRDGVSIAVGGFGLSGVPYELIGAVHASAVRNLTIVSNNMGVDGVGLGVLLDSGQVSRVVCSYAGENAAFAKQYLDGDIDVTFLPQGTLAERLRAGCAGIPAFYTPTGVGTDIAEGKELREFDGQVCLLELALRVDIALVHAYAGDGLGNLRYRMAARNFNPVVAGCGVVTVAEVEHLLRPGDIDPETVVTPGAFVDRIVECAAAERHIEQRTVRPKLETAEVNEVLA